ncbi:FeoA family protein [Capnocytophaga sp. oral taxon 878]|uniref:FeoA family protein n=1 Tax=Capnocytophaga sp. oral taxon 878 TaxID=1316596 RepID=UPI000D040734|nr:FeoA family protein [Capnocytophaga sp. oral taxon 878]AVM50699.1 ferrous iron transport protein A [Capnocytophaga sp. oral taxon 878]
MEENFKINSIAQLKKGEKGIIQSVDIQKIPMKLIELGCAVGNEVEVLQKASFGDPIYIRMNDVYLSIRKEMARHILLAN